ncbi:acyl-CoA synthetase [Brevundimonas sp.]|uniref:acyl-CoA synthetase n=1 Tax=Brevundimonas sp. TaxID=1871086 RepID=UPI001A1FFDF9|nr:acyl-CoA synthetase [Brevundimonas sp.]MBJ7483887.1 acyl-CoA synthetase [Brevundimonas sp.]
MHPSIVARSHPDKVAYIMAATREAVTYRQLDERSNQGAHLWRSLGLEIGDVIAFYFDNHPRFLELIWAAQRAGLYYVCVSNRLTPAEAGYVVMDSGAKALIVSASAGPNVHALSTEMPAIALLAVGGAVNGFRALEPVIADLPTTPISDQHPGQDFLYSSGTTGRPKGVKTALSPSSDLGADHPYTGRLIKLYAIDGDTRYLSPAPIYHAAPLRWAMAVQRVGGTVVILEKFDPENALSQIEIFKVTHSQWVPTHFIRMLKLPAEVRARYDLSSLKVALHAAAPCPIPVKEAMLAWWGPVIYEYYSGTEAIGMCAISPYEWVTHKGSVGRAMLGKLRICDDADAVLGPGQVGDVYFEDGPAFEYSNAPEKTASSVNSHGWRTMGDVGYVDAEGFLYLCDRKDFMIIVGGVNVYPQEIEDVLVEHPSVADAAVIGMPDDDMGQRPLAIVELTPSAAPGDALREELMAFMKTRLSTAKMPAALRFEPCLPREPNGKLMKRRLLAPAQQMQKEWSR